MSSFSTILTVIEACASKHPSSAAYKIPQIDPSTGRVHAWNSITYREFYQDIEQFAKYWSLKLKALGAPPRSVIGVWLGGTSYVDVLHVYSLSRAGYVPQLFSLRLPNPTVIYELLRKAGAKALIYDASFESILTKSPVPTLLAVNAKDAGDIDGTLPATPITVNADDTAYLLHTSGSTSGTPKLVPWTYSWLSNCIDKMLEYGFAPDCERPAGNWGGSVCHAGQHFMNTSIFLKGGCVIQPSKINFSDEEFVEMVERAGLNTLLQMGSYLSERLKRSHDNPKLLNVLRNISDIAYGGLPITREAEEWAEKNDIMTRSLFSSTECGTTLVTVNRHVYPPIYRTVEGVSYEFRPVEPDNETQSNSSERLLEHIVLSNSPDCPHPSLRHSDGHFHTGDLFEEVKPGHYISRGRNDDWIKAENGLKCDTKAIENNVGITCGHLVAECIVVGYGRPSPILFVEPATDMDHDKLKGEIIRATRPFNSRRYLHEQILDEKMIIVVPSKTLPRTAAKGNIRRKAVEEAYKDQLDAIYASL